MNETLKLTLDFARKMVNSTLNGDNDNTFFKKVEESIIESSAQSSLCDFLATFGRLLQFSMTINDANFLAYLNTRDSRPVNNPVLLWIRKNPKDVVRIITQREDYSYEKYVANIAKPSVAHYKNAKQAILKEISIEKRYDDSLYPTILFQWNNDRYHSFKLRGETVDEIIIDLEGLINLLREEKDQGYLLNMDSIHYTLKIGRAIGE